MVETDAWIRVEEQRPPDGVVVDTKIDDGHDVRNETPLKLVGSLWWMPDFYMYVYYMPTHWRYPTAPPDEVPR